MAVLDDPDDGGAATCGVTAVRVAAAADIAPVVESATEALEENDDCWAYDVAVTRPDQVVTALVAGGDDAPSLWVPDAAGWPAQVEAQAVRLTRISEAVASSPVLLVGGPAADEPESWLAALASGQVSMRDPLTTGTGAVTLAAVRAEQPRTEASETDVGEVLVPLAQRFGAARAGAGADPLSRVTATSTELVPSSEQAYLTARRTNGVLTAVVPRTGTLLQTYPLLAAPGASEEVLDAGRALAAYLTEGEGRAQLEQTGFRSPGGASLGEGRGVGTVAELPTPDAEDVATDVRRWLVLSVPSSVLAVVDVSASMDFGTSEGSRIALAAQAAGAALDAYPDTARIGLWAFSIDQGGAGVDYRELQPLRRLDAVVGGSTQRELLAGEAAGLPGLTTGGTGLYDTTLAAYRTAVEAYDGTYFNSVVLMTDGANDDPGSLRLGDLLRGLRDASDPARPVRVIAIGISEDADMDALTRIARATNGEAFPVRDPRDILGVLSTALLGR